MYRLISINFFDPIKIGEKSYKNIFYHNGYATVKDLSFAAINSTNPLYLTINKMNRDIEESNENKYVILIHTNESKGTEKL